MRYIWIFLMSITLIMPGCRKEEETDEEQFTNKLTLGTGMNGFNLTGEATSFYLTGGSLNIYWRLESMDDMSGSNVRILIEKNLTGNFQVIDTVDFNNPQSYGHIMLSSYNHNYGAGNFRATGILITGIKTIASKEYTAN